MVTLKVPFVSVQWPEIADGLIRGKFDTILKSRDFMQFVQKPIFLVSPIGVHGKVLLSRPHEISVREAIELKSRHGLSEDIIRHQWPGAPKLYAFTVVIIEAFKEPLAAELPIPLPAFGESVTFKNKAPSDISAIADLETYDPDKATRQQRLDDWRILIAHYANHLAGRKTPYPKDLIIKKAIELAQAMREDGVVFHPDTMTPAGQDLFEKVLAKLPDLPHTLTDEELSTPIGNVKRLSLQRLKALHQNLHLTWQQKEKSEEVANLHIAVVDALHSKGQKVDCPDDGLGKALPSYPTKTSVADEPEVTFTAYENAVSLIGSTVYAQFADVEPHDVDILFRDIPSEPLAHYLASHVDPTLPVHISLESTGPNWDYIGLGDYVLSNTEPEAQVEDAVLRGLLDVKPFLVKPSFVTTSDNTLFVDSFPASGLELKLSRWFKKPVQFLLEGEEPVLDLWFVPRRKITLNFLENDDKFRRAYFNLSQEIKASIKPGKPFRPLKAQGGYHIGEFYTVEDAITFWATPERLREGILVEPKVDGIRLVLHKQDDKVWIFTEDKQRDRAEVLPMLVEAARKLKHDVVLDMETVEYDDEGNPIPRHEMVELVVSKSPPKRKLIAWVHDCLFLDGKDLSGQPAIERIRTVHELLSEGILRPMPFRLVRTADDLKRAFEWASTFREGASEGAMLKEANSPYSGELTPAWAKVKLVREIKVQVIGILRKAMPWHEKPAGELRGTEAIQAYKRLAQDSDTYLVRGAILGPDGKLKPIEAKRELMPGDLELRWTGSEWRGLECPEIWQMAPGWPHRKPGELAYGTTYALAFPEGPPKFGDIVTVRPMEMQIFEWGGEQHVAWMFPILQEVDPTRRKPDTWEDVLRIVEFTKKRHKGVPTKEEVGISEGVRVPLTRDEARVATKKKLGYDWYVVRQPPKKTVDFVMQLHIRGIVTPDGAPYLRKLLQTAKTDEERKKIWADWGLCTLRIPLPELSKKLQELDDERKALSLTQFISQDPKEEGEVYSYGNCHVDLRLRHPTEEFLVGWTCDIVKIVLQPLDEIGAFIFPLRNRILQNQEGDQWLSQQKLSQPLVWLEIVSPQKKKFWREPGEVGATRKAGACFVFAARGQAVYGVQKSEHYHEYFLRFDEFGDVEHHQAKLLNGRWDFKYIEGEYEKTGGDWYWQGARPWKTQVPYILTHDFETEAAKERRAGRQWEWNANTISATEVLFGKHWWEG